MHLRFILGSPVYQYFILFLIKSPHLHFVNCISISICCKRTSEISSFNVSSKFNMFNITTRSCPKTSLVYFGCLKLTLYQRAHGRQYYFSTFWFITCLWPLHPLYLKDWLGIKSMPYIFLWAPWTWIWSIIVKVLCFSPYMKLGILLKGRKDFSFLKKYQYLSYVLSLTFMYGLK